MTPTGPMFFFANFHFCYARSDPNIDYICHIFVPVEADSLGCILKPGGAGKLMEKGLAGTFSLHIYLTIPTKQNPNYLPIIESHLVFKSQSR